MLKKNRESKNTDYLKWNWSAVFLLSQLNKLVELESEVNKPSSDIHDLSQKRKMKLLEIGSVKAELVSCIIDKGSINEVENYVCRA